ncbi:MAG: DUF4832 domain-containing protein [Paludibacteraceae bacterium]|nr:DUF4832 domain-containing protein [Paludibacteraceae bacterium]
MKSTHTFLALGFAVSALTCFSCNPDEPQQPDQPTNASSCYGDTLRADLPRIPLQSKLSYAQPMTGLVFFSSRAKELDDDYRNSISLEFAYCLPCQVVKGKENGAIRYDWTALEKILNDIHSRNHQAVIRVRYECPGSKEVDGKAGTTAVPAYIKALSDYHETYGDKEGATYYADWSNTELQWFTKQFFTDFAAKYGNDSRIAFLQVGFGHWSEYHIYGTALQLGKNFPTKAYQADFLTHLSQVMPIPWLISIDAADDYYTPIAASQSLLALHFGLFDDSFMHREHESTGDEEAYNEECWKTLNYTQRWLIAPNGGEISYYTSRDQKGFLNPAGLYGHTWEEQAAKYHITFMLANNAPDGSYGTPKRFLEAAHASGYRFKVLDIKGDKDSTLVLITNTGVAPIYREAHLVIGQQTAQLSLATLMPNDTAIVSIPAQLKDAKQLKITSSFVPNSRPIEFEANVTK